MVESDLLLGLDSVPIGDGPSPTSPSVPPSEPIASPDRPTPALTASPGDPATALSVAVDPEPLGTDAGSRLEELERRHETACTHCGSSKTHESVVFGEGDPAAGVMFVGEAPGAEEDRLGRPFVGPAGELLDRMIDSVGLSRSEVYVANLVKVRPPENRTPRPAECEACGPWLLSQIAAIRPRVIVALGATPTKYLLRTSTGITRLRGGRVDIEIGRLRFPVVPTFHPAYVLRQYTTDVRRAVWEDLKQAVTIAGE
jgi:DNA polymerase